MCAPRAKAASSRLPPPANRRVTFPCPNSAQGHRQEPHHVGTLRPPLAATLLRWLPRPSRPPPPRSWHVSIPCPLAACRVSTHPTPLVPHSWVGPPHHSTAQHGTAAVWKLWREAEGAHRQAAHHVRIHGVGQQHGAHLAGAEGGGAGRRVGGGMLSGLSGNARLIEHAGESMSCCDAPSRQAASGLHAPPPHDKACHVHASRPHTPAEQQSPRP